jgi:hypothetical protein
MRTDGIMPQITLFFLIICAFLGQSASQKKKQELYDLADAYEVYSAILPSEWPWRVAHAKKLTIRSETVPYTSCLRVGVEKRAPQPVAGATLPSKDEDIDIAIANYLQLNKEARLLKRAFRIDLPYELTSKDDLSVQQAPDTGGLIEVSAVGFNADKTIAVVYMGHHCGMLCGGGAIHVLVKSQGRWQPYGRVMGGIIGCPWNS